MASGPICGLLLAGGEGRRFGGDKLMAALADGTPVAVATARALAAGCDRVVAVTRPDRDPLVKALRGAGCEVVVTAACRRGMGASLAAAVAASGAAAGWLVLPADMPAVAGTTVAAVAAALRRGSLIARPELDGRPGHPVGFSAELREALAALDGDTGARGVVARHRDAVARLAVDDPGILADIDTPADLVRLAGGGNGT
ncbi:Nicotine blue oxidoreductase [wastewater metagenome]|uniref:Nicotine blue oxidoreductase n=2 Tax=unclassified sequences TaxID=12908 RepID=A0A5B8R972_9ZZZZ|nr:nucleotidyltransferase family protein [Arhodomonas aquaeolei]MCS4503486.1 nucleotidyltransferase family protein [Arhodomonas aquaeolei]QEA05699.1 nicotine blue oxidoreductase [uncultured organism]